MKAEKAKIMPEKLYTEAVRRLHFLIPLATLVPCMCTIVMQGAEETAADAIRQNLLALYFVTLLLAIPVGLIYLLEVKAKNILVFLLGAAACAFSGAAGLTFVIKWFGLSANGAEKWPQMAILIVYILDAIQMRINNNDRIRAKREADLSWTGDRYLLPRPYIVIEIWFAALYIISLFAHSREIGNVALAGAVLYFFLVMPYMLLTEKDRFLDKRKHISRIPGQQIRKLFFRRLSVILIPCALLAAVALLTSSGRRFLDLPVFHLPVFRLWGCEETSSGINRLAFIRMMPYIDMGAPPPQWLVEFLEFVENALAIFVLAFMVYFIYRMLRHAAQLFGHREVDEKEVLHTGSGDEHISLKKPRERRGAPDRGIRRKYRRTILHFRKEAPGISETPAMMEALAGLPETEEMKQLHRDYEQARYGTGKGS